ncbi:MAG: hypothetical protein LKE40_07765 [Spirochaetia bacterium]|nr:hypothetical protein [Spirochaetia bacterium]
MSQNKLVQFVSYNWKVKMTCLLLAICLVSFIGYARQKDREVTIPLTVVLPQGYQAESLVPKNVDIWIHGDEHLIYLIDPSQIKASADFSYVDKPGIAQADVVLSYDSDTFKRGEVTATAKTHTCRIKFGKVPIS